MKNKKFLDYGDSFNYDVKELIPYLLNENIKADCIIIDPPYKIIGGGPTTFQSGGIFNRNNPLARSGKLFKYNDIKFSEWVTLIYDVLKNNSHCYIYTNDKNLNPMLNECFKAGFKLHNIITWIKNTHMPTLYYMKKTEFILFLRKGQAKRINNLGDKNIFLDDVIDNKRHPTEKPVYQLETMILNSTNENDLVLDCFCGSGSLAEAAINTKRKFIVNDIDSEYYEKTNLRIKNTIDQKFLF